MLKKLSPDSYAALISILLSIVFLYLSSQYDYTGRRWIGPGFFPVWICGVWLVLSVVYFIQTIRRRGNEETGEVQDIIPKGKAGRRILITAANLILFIVLFKFVGFIAASVIFLFILLYGAYRWYVSLSVAIGVTLLLYWLFGIMLKVNIP